MSYEQNILAARKVPADFTERTLAALQSILGPNYMLHSHRHAHESFPGKDRQPLHQVFALLLLRVLPRQLVLLAVLATGFIF